MLAKCQMLCLLLKTDMWKDIIPTFENFTECFGRPTNKLIFYKWFCDIFCLCVKIPEGFLNCRNIAEMFWEYSGVRGEVLWILIKWKCSNWILKEFGRWWDGGSPFRVWVCLSLKKAWNVKSTCQVLRPLSLGGLMHQGFGEAAGRWGWKVSVTQWVIRQYCSRAVRREVLWTDLHFSMHHPFPKDQLSHSVYSLGEKVKILEEKFNI